MFEKEIAYGMSLLDKHIPNWRGNVKEEGFDISFCPNCVCGRAEGDDTEGYYHTLKLLMKAENESRDESQFEEACGFAVPDDEELSFKEIHARYNQLDAEWRIALGFAPRKYD